MVCLALFPPCQAQTDHPSNGDVKTETVLVDVIKQSTDPVARLKLLNAFVKTLPDSGSTTWAYQELFRMFEEAGEADRALGIGETILSRDPRDVETAYKSLQIAEKTDDAALVRKWSEISSKAAAAAISSPQAGEIGRARLAYARQVRVSLGYVDYQRILQVHDPGKRLTLIEAFLERNRGSEYRHAVETLYLATQGAMGDERKTVAAAERILKMDENEDALLILSERCRQSGTEPQKLTSYANRLLAASKTAKPIELTDAEWSKKKARLTGASLWLIGSAALQQDHYKEADKSIRAALPYLKEDPRLTSAALFSLGWANYQMRNFPDAIRFNQQCMTLPGPFRDQAARNLEVARAESRDQ
jgi:tetratricopeptide (TPR) repeat protein